MELGAASAHTTALTFNPAGTQLVTGRKDGRVLFWGTSDGRLLSEWQASKEAITDIVVHPDDARIAVATGDGWSLRDKKSGAIILEAKPDEEGGGTEELALSATGDLLLAVGDRFPQVWDLNARARVQTLAGFTDEVYSGAFSRDGRWLLTGSGYKHARGEAPDDGVAVVVWDASLSRQVLSYRSAMWAVETVSFSNDGTKIFAAGGIGKVRRYECEVCLPLPALTDLIAVRTARELSADERARYVPKNWLLDWMVAR
jgi:WD40 repeat protein